MSSLLEVRSLYKSYGNGSAKVEVLKGIDLDFEDVVMARIYLTRFKQDYAAVNATYRSYFAEGRLPARTCVGVTGLAYDALIEIDLVCRRPVDR